MAEVVFFFFLFFFTEAAADFIIVTESALIIWFLHVHIKVSPAQERNTYTQLVNSEHAAYSRCAVSNKAIDIFFDHWDCLPLRNTGERIKMTVCFSVYQLDNACVVCGCQSVVWIGLCVHCTAYVDKKKKKGFRDWIPDPDQSSLIFILYS